jgi:RHS repeat-associated protein
MKKIIILFLLVGFKLSAQNRELVELVTKHAFENKSYIYTKGVKLLPPVGGGSFRINASEHGTFFIKPADATRIPQNIPPSLNQNFLRAETILVKDILNEDQITSLPSSQIAINYEYLDALGRPLQNVSKNNSPLGYDIVKHFTYDAATGRSSFDYMPYVSTGLNGGFRANSSNEQSAFFGPSSSISNDSRPFEETSYELSPLDRVLKTTSEGIDWFSDNRGNSSTLKIDMSGTKLFWEYDESTKQPSLSIFNNPGGYYPAGMLSYSESKNEGNNVAKVYSDFLERNVLTESQNIDGSWLQTYTVYDGLGRPRVIFPPEASANISQYLSLSTTALRQDFLDQWTYQFIYDGHGRMSKKKVPGSGWTYYVYDKWDRLVLSQDAEQRSSNKWSFTKYDRFNRAILTGVYSVGTSHATLQSDAMVIADANRHESQVNTGIGYTLANSFPSGISESNVNVVTYYDNYDFMFAGWDQESNTYTYSNPLDGSIQKLGQVKGKATGSKVRVLDDTKWLNSVIYYDGFYNPIQTIDEVDIGGVVRTTKKFDFVGNVEKIHHLNSYTNISEEYSFYYGHAKRVSKIDHVINGGQPVTILSNKYDELGQLIEKNLHSSNGGNSYLQSIDYQYNIRGWRTGINTSSLAAQPGDPYGDLFGMEIQYNSVTGTSINGAYTTESYFDGSISSVKWKTNTLQPNVTPLERIYGYDYDVLNRLTFAYSASNNNGNWNGEGGMFDEQVSEYDRHGNIVKLNRWGKVENSTSKTQIDQLTYGYELAGKKTDKLITVDDATSHKLGFKPALANVTEEYVYNDDGSLEYDHNKGISSVTYNHLKLPTMIELIRSDGQVDKIYYAYDGLGNRLSKRIHIDGTHVWTTRYSKHYQYDFDPAKNITRLSYFLHPEGRILNNGNGFEYEYFLSDYLGNARVGFGSLKETSSYRATMELSLASKEEGAVPNGQGFRNLPQTRSPNATVNITAVSEQTPTPNRSAICHGLSNPVGPAKYLRVLSGDAVYMEVFAQYQQSISGANTNNIASSLIVTALTGINSFNIPNAGETAKLWSGINTNIGYATGAFQQSSTTPKAYLAYLFFNDAHDFSGGAADGVGLSAFENFQKLDRSFTAPTNGHLYIYVVNECKQANVNVYFDDLFIVHQKSTSSLQVTQATDYYPFGLPFNEYHSDRLYTVTADPNNPQNNVYSATLRNRKLFQGKELEKNIDLNWYDFEARMYDPALGRFNGVDPLSDKQANQSAYNFVWNNPSGLVDPDGKWPGLPYGAGYVSPRVVNWAQQAESRSMQAMFQRMQPFNYDLYIANKIQGQMSDALSRHVSHWAGKQSSHQTGGGVGAQGSFERMFNTILTGVLPVIPGVAMGILDVRRGNYGAAALNLGLAFTEGSSILSMVSRTTSTNLYRAVFPGELQDISAFGGFRLSSQGYQTSKLFASSAQDAANYGRMFYGSEGSPFTVMKTSISNKYLSSLYSGPMDYMKAFAVPPHLLSTLSSPVSMSSTFLPNLPWVTPNYYPKTFSYYTEMPK